MLSFLLSVFSGPLVGAVTGVINKYITAGVDREKLHAEVEQAILGTLKDISSSQADVIKQELQSESWLPRNVRAVVMLGSFLVLVFFAIFVPCTVAYFGWPAPRVGNELLGWINNLTVISVGGYVGGRTLEKIATIFVGRWK